MPDVVPHTVHCIISNTSHDGNRKKALRSYSRVIRSRCRGDREAVRLSATIVASGDRNVLDLATPLRMADSFSGASADWERVPQNNNKIAQSAARGSEGKANWSSLILKSVQL